MKKVFVVVFMIFFGLNANSQNYEITFLGSGAAITVDSVRIENLSQCTDTVMSGGDILQLTGAVGVDNTAVGNNNSVMVFPNPSAGSCFIDIEQSEGGEACIEIFDISGKTVLLDKEYLSTGVNHYLLSGTTAGMYFLKVKSALGSSYFKILCTDNINCNGGLVIKKIINSGLEKVKGNIVGKITEKAVKSTFQMLYFNGERLKFTGYSGGVYATVITLVPTQDQIVTFNFVPCTDIDGNSYAVVQIGTQLWMAENLKTTHYRNGDIIQNIIDNTQWQNMGAGARCYYNHDSAAYSSIYGCFYNGFAVNDSRGIAPQGWHCPSQTEFSTLITSMGGASGAGAAIKDPCCTLWTSPNTGANNSSGVTALPLGARSYYGNFMYFNSKSIFWGTNERILWVNNNEIILNSGGSALQYGQPLRCIKD